jgi:thiamine-phosphate pyrophosphorylase
MIPRGIWCVLSGLDARQVWTHGAAAAAAGAAALTLRRPACSARAAVEAFLALAGAAGWRATHGHADWGQASGAAAVIAGADSLSVADYRRAFAGLLTGASVHDAEEARIARAAGAAFLIFGPVWETPSKAGWLAPRGLGALAEVTRLGLPVIASGGIVTVERVRAARAQGAHGCAVLRAASNPALLEELVAALP